MKLVALRLSRHSWSDVEARRPPGQQLRCREPARSGFCTEARLPPRLVPGLCPAPREASAPPARSKSAGRVAERLISCLGIVFLLRNHCPVLHSRLGRSRWHFPGFQDLQVFLDTLGAQPPWGHELENQTHLLLMWSLADQRISELVGGIRRS